MKKKHIITSLFFTIVSCCVLAQEIHGNTDVWLALNTNFKLSSKLKFNNELHLRRTDWIKTQEQFVIRPSFVYSIKPNFTFTLGYSYLRTSPYGDHPLPTTRPENNTWEQFLVIDEIGKTQLTHRFRFENRFISHIKQMSGNNYELDGIDVSHRFRYRIILKRNISKKLFVQTYEEVFLSFSEQLQLQGFDRNWFYLGLGLKVNSFTTFQAGYFHHWAKNSETRFERHHSISTSLTFNL